MKDAPCSIYDHHEQHAWRHLDTMQFKTWLVAQVLRIHCKEHGIKSLQVPWTGTQTRFTHLFERFAIDVLSACSSKTQMAKLLGLLWDEVHHFQSRAEAREMNRRSVDEVKHVGIDEKNFRKGQSYACLLYDLNGVQSAWRLWQAERSSRKTRCCPRFQSKDAIMK